MKREFFKENEQHLKIQTLRKLMAYLKNKPYQNARHFNVSTFKDQIKIKILFNFGYRSGYWITYDFVFKDGICNEIQVWGKDCSNRRWEYYIPIKPIKYETLKEKILNLL